MTRHVLPGLRPTPLGSYLAGLGLFRLLAEQVDPRASAAWSDNGLVIESTVDDLAAWLVDTYVPTPVLSPWNEGSGFGAKDKTPKETLDRLVSTESARLSAYRTAVTTAREVAQAYRSAGWSKERAVREFRNKCPDELVPGWMRPWCSPTIRVTSHHC
jgi:CRISPR-associated protein Csx17